MYMLVYVDLCEEMLLRVNWKPMLNKWSLKTNVKKKVYDILDYVSYIIDFNSI